MTSTVPALCAGVITEICDDEFIVNDAGTVPNITAETELNPVPLIVRALPPRVEPEFADSPATTGRAPALFVTVTVTEAVLDAPAASVAV